MSSNKKINNNLLVISKYMDELELDNCRLRNSDEILNNVIEEKDKEIERLNNIIKKLEQENAVLKTQVISKDKYSYGIRTGSDKE